MLVLTHLLIPGVCAAASVVGTYAACDALGARIAHARHRRAARRAGRMLTRAYQAGEWR